MTRGHYSSIAVIKMNDGPALTIDGQPSPYLHLHKPDHLGFSFENTALSILDAVIGGPARAQSSKGGGDNFGAIAGILFLRFANQKVRGLKLYGWEMLVGDVLDWLAHQPEATCRVCHTPGLAVMLCTQCRGPMCSNCYEPDPDSAHVCYLCSNPAGYSQ